MSFSVTSSYILCHIIIHTMATLPQNRTDGEVSVCTCMCVYTFPRFSPAWQPYRWRALSLYMYVCVYVCVCTYDYYLYVHIFEIFTCMATLQPLPALHALHPQPGTCICHIIIHICQIIIHICHITTPCIRNPAPGSICTNQGDINTD